ncbi:MAG: hypothetical protein IJ874_03785 [Ruminococcus sp.]|nr:hypothetical protein [Ruminococcus sp.]
MRKGSLAVLMSVLVLTTGCSMGTAGNTGNDIPVSVTVEEKDTLALKLRFLPLTEVLYGAEPTDEQLSGLYERFQARCNGYDAVMPELCKPEDPNCVTTFIPDNSVSPLVGSSPLAAALYGYQESVVVNPTRLVDDLTQGSRMVGEVYDSTDTHMDYSGNTPVVFADRGTFMTAALGDIYSGKQCSVYQHSSGLYAANIVDVGSDIITTAVYFDYTTDEKGEYTLTRAGVDQVIYTGRELLLDESDKGARTKAAIDFPGGDYMAYDSTFSSQKVSEMIVRLLGSSSSQDSVISGGNIKTEREEYRLDPIDDTDSVKGIHIVRWYYIDN